MRLPTSGMSESNRTWHRMCEKYNYSFSFLFQNATGDVEVHHTRSCVCRCCAGRDRQAELQITTASDGATFLQFLWSGRKRCTLYELLCMTPTRRHCLPPYKQQNLHALRCAFAREGLLDPALAALTCGQWVAINEVKGQTPFTDFCNVIGGACNAQGEGSGLGLEAYPPPAVCVGR